MAETTDADHLLPHLDVSKQRVPQFLRIQESQLQLLQFGHKKWAKVSKLCPCPVCKRTEGHNRCAISRDGQAVICRWLPSDVKSDSGWVHGCAKIPFPAQRILPDPKKYREDRISKIIEKNICSRDTAIEIIAQQDADLTLQMTLNLATNTGLRGHLELLAGDYECDLLHAYSFWLFSQSRSDETH